MKNDMLGRWNSLWRRLGSAGNMEPLFHDLLKAYGGRQRAYHDFDHVRRCLAEFDTVRNRLDHPDEVELAIWFHDAVYDPRSSRNEEDSAEFAESALKKAHIGDLSIGMIKTFILATKHNGSDYCSDAHYLMDIDIATFGSAPGMYRKYEENIRKEYDWVPDSIYREKRKELLMSFLNKDQLYHTDFFRSRYARMARKNLEAAVRDLK